MSEAELPPVSGQPPQEALLPEPPSPEPPSPEPPSPGSPRPGAPPEALPRPPRHHLLPLLCGVGFVILAGAIVFVWMNPRANNPAIDQRLAVLSARIAKLEQQPIANVGQLQNQVAILEGRVGDAAKFQGQLDTMSGRIESLSGRDQSGLDEIKQEVDALTAKVASFQANAGNLDAAAKRLNRIARLEEASFNLNAGRPIGDIDGAPEELARYAHVAPPTDTQLRLSFQSAAQNALNAPEPDNGSEPLWDRVKDRVGSVMTLRRGDTVLVGTSTAVTLNRARTDLDAGDLAGAVTAVQSLDGAPAQAMTKWLAQAKALLSARAVLAEMVDHA